MERLLDVFAALFLGKGFAAASLLFLRVLPVVALTPLFGGRHVPQRFRFGMAIALTIVLLPTFIGNRDVPTQIVDYAPVAAVEVLVGLSIAVFIILFFELLASAGGFIDLARGAMNASIYDPTSEQSGTPLTVFMRHVFLVLFFSIGGDRLFIWALGRSFEVVPPGGQLPPGMRGMAGVESVVGLLSDLFVVSLQLAAPAVAVLLLLDVALGLINRVAQQIQVFFLGMTVKGALGLLVLFFVLGLSLDELMAGMLRRMLTWFQ
ncbi:MAG: flagellar biosynthetic protein FliR [Planctomycetota bacterium]